MLLAVILFYFFIFRFFFIFGKLLRVSGHTFNRTMLSYQVFHIVTNFKFQSFENMFTYNLVPSLKKILFLYWQAFLTNKWNNINSSNQALLIFTYFLIPTPSLLEAISFWVNLSIILLTSWKLITEIGQAYTMWQ